MRKERKNYTAEEKVAILRRHLVEKEPISKLCDEQGLQPTVFYRWQKELMEHAALVFQRQPDKRVRELEEKLHGLEAKLKKKNEVLAELMEEHVKLKKNLGER